jgi:hypothetical protein
MVSRNNTLWIGTEGGGLIRYRDGVFRAFSSKDGLTNDFVRVVFQSSSGEIWIGTDNGLFRFAGEQIERVDNAGSVPLLAVHAITEDGEGGLWVGGSRLLRLHAAETLEYHLSGEASQNRVKSIAVTRGGTIWVGTVSGLHRMDVSAAGTAFHRMKEISGTVCIIGMHRHVAEVIMSSRMAVFSVGFVLLLLLLLTSPADAKNKKKQVLPDYVLRAQTVLVVVNPDAGEPLANPTANMTAQDNVEKALLKWGRFKLVMDVATADLVVVVRKGYAGGPVVSNSPADDRPVIYQPAGGDIRVAGQHGTRPALNDPGVHPPPDRGPQLSSETGPSEDTLEVYQGDVEYPLDAAPLWRYMAKDALSAPTVAAVEQFHNAVNESEKQHQQKP